MKFGQLIEYKKSEKYFSLFLFLGKALHDVKANSLQLSFNII